MSGTGPLSTINCRPPSQKAIGTCTVTWCPGCRPNSYCPFMILADVAPVGIVQRILGIVQGLYAVLRYLTGKRLDSRACPDDGVANGSDGLDRHLVTRLISGPCGEGLDAVNVVVAGDDGCSGGPAVGLAWLKVTLKVPV